MHIFYPFTSISIDVIISSTFADDKKKYGTIELAYICAVIVHLFGWYDKKKMTLFIKQTKKTQKNDMFHKSNNKIYRESLKVN